MSTSSELAVYETGGLQVMTPELARQHAEQLRQCVKAVLREGIDYGTIPGTGDEKVLFRPGAQQLLLWFTLGFTCERTDTEFDTEGRKHGITYRATVTHRGTGHILATCEGTADYDESKFFKPAEQVQREAEAKERNFARIDKRPANPTKWQNLPEYRAPWNTLMKRAQKRAIVGAVIDATAAGGVFREEDDTRDAAPDGGPSWYQDALGAALVLPDVEAGRELHRASADAVLSGAITPKQATHIQNRIAQRVKMLQRHKQVDFESPSSAQAGPPSADPAAERASSQGAEEASVPPAEQAPGSRPSRGQRSAGGTSKPAKDDLVNTIGTLFGKLGVTDDSDRVVLAAEVARLDDIPATLDALSYDELQLIVTITGRCSTIEELRALINDGEVHDA